MNTRKGMTHRERFECVLAGETPDQVPVFANLDFWYRARQLDNDWPQGMAGRSLQAIMLDLGIGLTAGTCPFRVRFRPPVEFACSKQGLESVEEWRLPQGTLRRVRISEPRQQALGMNSHLRDYPVTSAPELKLFIELMRHVRFEADTGFQNYFAAERAIGDNGVVIIGLGKSPAHDMIMKWTGYENAYIFMAEEPDLFAEAIEAATTAFRPAWEIVADSPCPIVRHGGNYSAMTPPPVFERFLLPGLKAFNRVMHEAGKKVLAHTDGDMTGLLDLFLEAGFDGTNCHACEPMVACRLEDCFKAWGDKVTLWGGMPCVMLEPHTTEAEFQAHLKKLTKLDQRGMPLIVGVSDHAMPDASYRRIAEMARFFAGTGT